MVLLKDLTAYSEFVVNRGVGLPRVAGIVFFEALPLMSQMLPFAVLVGGLVGLGRLTADLEIRVLSALGVDPRQLIAPVALFGAFAAVVGLMLTLFVAPWAHRGLARSFLEIAERHPGAGIQPGVVDRFGDWKLQAREVSGGGEQLAHVLLWIPSLAETVFARAAEIGTAEGGGREITLKDGAFLLDTRKTPSAVRFDEIRTTLPAAEDLASASIADRLGGMPVGALYALAGDARGGQTAIDARSELHRRFVLPAATVLFGVLALPLTSSRSRASKSGGAVIGLLVTVAYYGLMQLATGLGQRFPGFVGPAAWLPDLVLLGLTVLLFRRLANPWAGDRRSARSGWRFLRRRAGSRPAARVVEARRWALPRYVAGLFIQLSLACFAVLVTAYLLVDILERLQWFARHAAQLEEIVRFYSARIPLLVSRVVPMGLLVAMALTVGLLTSRGELAGMRSCGISARRALRPTLLVCLLVVPLSFLLTDQVVSRTNEIADLIKRRDIKGGDMQRGAVWSTHGRMLYQLENLDMSLEMADGIVVYELGADGLPESRVDARSAHHMGNGLWRLQGTTRVEMEADGRIHSVPPRETVELGDEPSSELDMKNLSVRQILDLIREFAAAGNPTTPFEVDLHLKLATPLACLLLPSLVIVFAVTGPPFPSSASTLVLAGGLAVGYTVIAGAFASFGRSGALAPWIAGWGPSLLATLGLAWLGWRSRMSQRGG